MIGKVREDVYGMWAHGFCLEARALLLGMPSAEAARSDESEQGEGCQTGGTECKARLVHGRETGK